MSKPLSAKWLAEDEKLGETRAAAAAKAPPDCRNNDEEPSLPRRWEEEAWKGLKRTGEGGQWGVLIKQLSAWMVEAHQVSVPVSVGP